MFCFMYDVYYLSCKFHFLENILIYSICNNTYETVS